MKQQIADHVRELFKAKKISGFIAPIAKQAEVAPHVFTSAGELEQMVTGDEEGPGAVRFSFYRLLVELAQAYPRDTFALLVRGCEERALASRLGDERFATLDPKRIILVGFSCPPELAERCNCAKPWPDALVAGEKTPGVSLEADDADILDDYEKWLAISDRCLKCFGCRNACPVCGCKECTIEREVLVPQRQLPPSHSFLLTRAVHMVDRCVSCGLCEAACPSNIPLREVYRLVSRMVGQGGMLYDVQRVAPGSDRGA